MFDLVNLDSKALRFIKFSQSIIPEKKQLKFFVQKYTLEYSIAK